MQPCPRQTNEATMTVQREHVSHWRPDGTCSYCGSIDAATLFAAIEAGAQLEPTDKNYKVYVTIANPKAGQRRVISSASGPSHDEFIARGYLPTDSLSDEDEAVMLADGYGKGTPFRPALVKFGVHEPTTRAKFYFQHLTDEERRTFVGLMNAKRINLAYPGHFYRLPFFVAREAATGKA